MVWTSGLSDNEKDFDITSDYQLVKSAVPDNWSEKITGMYLLTDSGLDIKPFLGQCVVVGGKIKAGWENLADTDFQINGFWTYDRSALIIDRIVPKELDYCLSKDESGSQLNPDEKNYRRFRGILGYANRPAPDISYDLEIILDEPFLDSANASGQEVLTKRLDISAGQPGIYKQLLQNVGREVELGGYMTWGYAESQYLQVTSIYK